MDTNSNDTSGEQYSELQYMVTLKRNSIFYICIIFIPTYLVTALSLVGFFIPFDNNGNRVERVTLGLTTFLSLVVMLNIVGDEIPKATNLPQLGKLVVLSKHMTIPGGFVLAECLLCCAGVSVAIAILFAHQRVSTRQILPAGKSAHLIGTKVREPLNRMFNYSIK